jgi:hypothetical protein
MEHRWGERVEVNRAVRLRRAPAVIGWGRLTNVSLTGAYVETSLPLPPLTYVEVEPLGHDGAGERLGAYVVRGTSAGAGLEWCEPEEAQGVWAGLNEAEPPSPRAVNERRAIAEHRA